VIDPALISAAIVSKLQAISTVVSEVEVASNISAYEDDFPGSVSLFSAIAELSNPRILVVWNGSGPGQLARMEVWKHRFSLILKSRNKYTTLWAAIANGIPTGGDGLNFRKTTIHANCLPMDTPTCDRRTLLLTEQTTIDYFEVQFGLTERRLLDT